MVFKGTSLCVCTVVMHTWTGRSAWFLSQRAWENSQGDKSTTTTHKLHLQSATHWRLCRAVD